MTHVPMRLMKCFLPLCSLKILVDLCLFLHTTVLLTILFLIFCEKTKRKEKNQSFCLSKSLTRVDPFMFFWHNSGICCQSSKRGKKRTIDTVFFASKLIQYPHKYVKCCGDEYFKHYTCCTACRLK